MTDTACKPLLSGRAQTDPRVVAIGECMVELSPTGTPGEFRQGFAGDTFNTAWYLRHLRPGWAVRYVTRTGRDALSERMVEMMRAADIDTDHIHRSDTRTVGLYLISLDRGERSFSYWRDRSAARELADDPDALGAAIRDADVIAFSGITMAILPPEGRTVLLTVLQNARAAGSTVVFDTNMRPRLWQSATEMRASIMVAAATADIVLPSFDEECAQFGDATPTATVARYSAVGAHTVVVKNGPDPVQYRHGEQSGSVAIAPLAQIVDTTSAGDSFNAGLLAALGQGERIEDAIAAAARVASQVIAQPGALVPLKEIAR